MKIFDERPTTVGVGLSAKYSQLILLLLTTDAVKVLSLHMHDAACFFPRVNLCLPSLMPLISIMSGAVIA